MVYWLRNWLNVRGMVVQFPAGAKYLVFSEISGPTSQSTPLLFNVHQESFSPRRVTTRGQIRPLTSILVPGLRKGGAKNLLPHMPLCRARGHYYLYRFLPHRQHISSALKKFLWSYLRKGYLLILTNLQYT